MVITVTRKWYRTMGIPHLYGKFIQQSTKFVYKIHGENHSPWQAWECNQQKKKKVNNKHLSGSTHLSMSVWRRLYFYLLTLDVHRIYLPTQI